MVRLNHHTEGLPVVLLGVVIVLALPLINFVSWNVANIYAVYFMNMLVYFIAEVIVVLIGLGLFEVYKELRKGIERTLNDGY